MVLLIAGAVALGAGLHAGFSPPTPPLPAANADSGAAADDGAGISNDAPAREAAEPEAPRVEPVRRNLRDVTPSGMVHVPRPQSQTVVRLPAIVPPPPPPRPVKPRRWERTRVLSAGVVQSGGAEIRIAGIEALPGEAQCGPAGEAQWPCGNFARAALRRLLRGRPIECDPVDTPAEKAGETRSVITRCEIDGRDIGEWLVSRGWARPAPATGDDAGSPYAEALQSARAERRGQWGDPPAPIPAGEAAQADY